MSKPPLSPEEKAARQKEYCRRYYERHGERVKAYQAGYRQGKKAKAKNKKPTIAKLPLFGDPYATYHDDYYHNNTQTYTAVLNR